MINRREFRLAGLTINPIVGEVHGPAGGTQLDPKVMDVLVSLARRAGNVVLREELHREVWHGAVVTDDALSRCIYQLRRHLTEAGGPGYRSLLETLPKRGYRLNCAAPEAADARSPVSGNADPEVVMASPPSAPRDGYRFIGTVPPSDLPVPAAAGQIAPRAGEPSYRRRRTVGTGLVLVLGIVGILWYMRDQQVPSPDPVTRPSVQAEGRSIAVLPFEDLSPKRDQQYFSYGLTEELLNILARSRRLRVIARTSSFSFEGDNVDIATVANKLNVTHVLEGSVRKSGDQLRITVQLIDAATSSHLWSQTYDRELDDIFKVQSDIAISVANALQVVLGDDNRPRIPGDAQAYESFLRAQLISCPATSCFPPAGSSCSI